MWKLDIINHVYLYLVFSGSGICFPVIKSCVFGSEAKSGLLDDASIAPRNEGNSGSPVKQVIKLIFCAAGLQVRLLPENTVNGNMKLILMITLYDTGVALL